MRKYILILFALLFSLNSLAIKVLLADDELNIAITATGSFVVVDSNESDAAKNKHYKFDKGSFTIQSIDENCVKFDTIRIAENLVIMPDSGTIFTTDKTEKNAYTGTLITRPANNGFRLIEIVGLEEYLYGVLPFEMSASWPLEALKVQAVAARTYAARNLIEPEDFDFDVYSGVMSQVYKGAGNIINPQNRKIYQNVIAAVDETQNQVLTYDGKLFTAYFHSNCGGFTGPPVWNKPEDDIKPLAGAECGACVKLDFKNKNWSHTFTNEQIQAFTSTLYTDESKDKAVLETFNGKISQISIDKKTIDGRSISFMFTSENGNTATATCQDLRLGIGAGKLKSCNIDKITKEKNGSFSFSGRGFGHGVGMCQMGAKRLADEGKKYKTILSIYYPESEVMDYRDRANALK